MYIHGGRGWFCMESGFSCFMHFFLKVKHLSMQANNRNVNIESQENKKLEMTQKT